VYGGEIGNFKKNGKTWSKKAEEVEEHDFTSLATYRTIPYGIFLYRTLLQVILQ
jgi:hypothetical protein